MSSRFVIIPADIRMLMTIVWHFLDPFFKLVDLKVRCHSIRLELHAKVIGLKLSSANKLTRELDIMNGVSRHVHFNFLRIS